MEFAAQPRTIRDTLDLKRKYIIPRFQREYSWEEEEFSELWEDLLDNIQENGGKLQASEYFIGTLVLVGDDDDTHNIDRQVVDGQQRLMTFTIIFSVLSQILKDHNEEKLGALLHNYIVGIDEDGEKYTKIISETPKPFFQFRIQQEKIDFTQVPQTQEEKRILAAYNYFKHRFLEKNFTKDLLARFSDVEITYIDMLKLFRDQILACKVIYVTVKSFEDGYAIFEVLNAKGKSLSPVDIIKNSIFSVLDQTQPVDLAYEKWKNIRANITEAEIDDITTFFRHYWLSKYSFTTTKKLVSEFDNIIQKKEDTYTLFLNDLEKASENYVKISKPKQSDWSQPEDAPVFESLEALSVFGITQVRTFLLALFEIKEKKIIKHKDYLMILKFLQYYHFVFNAVCSKRPSGLERRYSSYARELHCAKNTNEAKSCILDLKNVLEKTLPSIDEFKKSFSKIYYTEKKSTKKKLVQYILKKIESYMSGSNEMKITSFTIEHILAQSTNNDLVGCIGNLLPLGSEINTESGDKCLADKLPFYKTSQYNSVKNFISAYCNNDMPVWTESEIVDRTDSLAVIMYKEST